METKETNEFVFSPTEEPDQLWVLSKGSGQTYRVDFKDFVCSCDDFKFRHAKGDRMCKHLKAASEAYGVEAKPLLPAVAEVGQAITISREEVMQEISKELQEEMIRSYVYAVPDYEREYTDKSGKKKTTKKAGWIDLTATGGRDLAHMVADRYGPVEVGEFRFMDVGGKWIAWRDIKLGNFTATGFAESAKDREFPFRYLGNVVMRNAYKAIVPKVYQDIFTNKFKELMRAQLKELLRKDFVMLQQAEGKKVPKPIAELTDGELAKELKEAQEKCRLKAGVAAPAAKKTDTGAATPAEPTAEEPEELFPEEEVGTATPAEATKPEQKPAVAKPKRDPESIKTIQDLYRACHQDFKMQPKEVIKELGYSSQSEINETPAICYAKIAATRS